MCLVAGLAVALARGQTRAGGWYQLAWCEMAAEAATAAAGGGDPEAVYRDAVVAEAGATEYSLLRLAMLLVTCFVNALVDGVLDVDRLEVLAICKRALEVVWAEGGKLRVGLEQLRKQCLGRP